MSDPSITMWLEGSEIKMRFPYDAGFIAALKEHFCAAWRSYDETTRTWGVAATKYPELRKLVGRHFLTIDELGYLAPIRTTNTSVDVLAQVLLDLPPPVLEKVYKVIMREVHPDHGGSLEMAKRVNEAWERLRRG
jgi:hypothetical protein